MVRVTENRLEQEGKERGLFSYLSDNVEFQFLQKNFFWLEIGPSNFMLPTEKWLDSISYSFDISAQ